MKTVEQTELHNYKKIEEAYRALKEVETPFLPTELAKQTLRIKQELKNLLNSCRGLEV